MKIRISSLDFLVCLFSGDLATEIEWVTDLTVQPIARFALLGR
jgi:hypothetical protein